MDRASGNHTEVNKIIYLYFSHYFQAFECMLCEVAPVPSARCPAGTWSQDATKKFIELAGDRRLVAKVLLGPFIRGKIRRVLHQTRLK